MVQSTWAEPNVYLANNVIAVIRHSRDISRRTVHGQTNAHTYDVMQPSKIAEIVPSLWLACLRRRAPEGSGKSRTFRGAKPRRGRIERYGCATDSYVLPIRRKKIGRAASALGWAVGAFCQKYGSRAGRRKTPEYVST